MKAKYIALFALAAAVAFAPAAMADSFNFSFNGGGISSSGTLTVSQSSSPGVDKITGISGTFSDANIGTSGISGAITGLYTPVSYVSDTLATPGVAFTTGGLSYDDLFYPAGDSPAICYDINPITGKPELTYPFSGGQFDIFGVAFNVAGGYTAELWSNGDIPGKGLVYAAGLANGTKLIDNPNAGTDAPPGEFGSLTTTPTPESGTLALFGIGLLGIAALWVRRIDWLRSSRM